MRRIKSDSRIISLAIFLIYAFFVFPIKSLLFSNWRFTVKFATAVCFVLMIVFSVFLVFQINREAAERYMISKYEDTLDQLTKDNQNLEIQFSKANAIKGASGLAQKLNFEKVSQISYIKLAANKVVKK